MGYRLTGLNGPFFGLSWEKTDGDKKTARSVVTFLEGRRLLFGDRHVEDEHHCVRSALAIRKFLTEQIDQAKPGKQLEASLKAMPSARYSAPPSAAPPAKNSCSATSRNSSKSPPGIANPSPPGRPNSAPHSSTRPASIDGVAPTSCC